MSNPFFNSFGTPAATIPMLDMLDQIKTDPIGFLSKYKNINIPRNVPMTAEGITDYLLSTGQITQNQINTAYPIASNVYRNSLNGGYFQ